MAGCCSEQVPGKTGPHRQAGLGVQGAKPEGQQEKKDGPALLPKQRLRGFPFQVARAPLFFSS